MPSRAEATFLPKMYHNDKEFLSIVSMPFRAEATFLPSLSQGSQRRTVNVSMPFRAETPFLRSGIFDQMESEKHGINALSG